MELLRRRYLHLALPDTDPVPPASEEGVHVLYPRFVAAMLPHGTAATLRSFLRLLSQGIQRRALITPITSAGPEEVLGLTAEEYRRQLEDRIGIQLVAAAAALAQGHRALDEVRQLEFQQATGVAKSTAQREWKRLLANDVLYQTREDCDGAWHRFSAEATVAFGML